MNYLLLLAALIAAIHAYSFAHWLSLNDNKSGSILVMFIIFLALGVPIYRMVTAP